MEEIWKEIEGYDGFYQISNFGRVKSFYNHNNIKERYLKLLIDKDGYFYVDLNLNGNNKKHKVHRLVASAFIENKNNLPQVNHLDENKQNNHVNNLEWCTAQYNNIYGNRLNKVRKRVSQFDLKNNLVKEWNSAIEIEKTLGFFATGIIRCCKNKSKTCYKYIWKYAD